MEPNMFKISSKEFLYSFCAERELDAGATTEDSSIVQIEGSREIAYAATHLRCLMMTEDRP